MNALRQFDPDLALGWVAKYIIDQAKHHNLECDDDLRVLREPDDYLVSLKEAVEDVVALLHPKYRSVGKIHVTLTGGYASFVLLWRI